ncbi:MAG TPA: trypsin-like peptidase domain-containing protein [Actinomycetes bacterium]|jgi:putative serine protease PepD|nr:trypsin-like peptidase domain-containing protein [Actinomycetes bacterium]
MSSRDGMEPSRSQSPTDTHPLPDEPGGNPRQEPEAAGSAPTAPTWGWSEPAPSWADPVQPTWGQAGTTADAGAPAWQQPEPPAEQPTQPVWGQGGGSGWGAGPGGPTWGERPAAPDRPRDRRRLGMTLAAIGLAVVLLAGAYGIGQAVGRDNGTAAPAGAGVPVPAASVPAVKGGSEPVAAVAKALLPAIVEIRTRQGLGSGVVYDRNGYILTAAHVVEGNDQVTVRLADGTQVNGRVLGTDESNDVGVVKVNHSGLTAAPLALGVKLQVGQMAVAIGSPFGLDQTVTAGVVSATSRAIDAQTANGQQTVRQVLQTDAPINPGNSGGALADREGRVIGINDAIESGGNGNGNVGIGFAIPIDIAARSAQAIVQGKQIKAGYIGVSSGDSTSSSQAGALVESVVGGGPAAKAGVQVGDLVTAVNGQAVQDSGDLAAQIRALAPGQKVELTLLRDGRQRTATVTLGENPNG